MKKGMKSLLICTAAGLVALALAACNGGLSNGSESASENHRLDLGGGVVAAFVEGLTPGTPGTVAYLTHVPSGTQAVLDQSGELIHRHDGRAGGPERLDAIFSDDAAMARINKILTNGQDARPVPHTISWVSMVQFGGTRYAQEWGLPSHVTREGYRDLAPEDMGPELYRVAFRSSGYVGPFYKAQDGDSTFLNPGTPVHAVKGYSPEFRLAALEKGGVALYEADTNPAAQTGEDLLDIRGRVTAIDILNDDRHLTVITTIDEEATIEEFVEVLLAAPVNQLNRDHDGPRYFVGIRLADGTAVVRPFWQNTGKLAKGIMGGDGLASIVSDALPVSHRTREDGQ